MRLRVGEGSGAPTPSASRQPEEQNGRSGLGRKAATPPGWCPHPSTPAWRVPVLPPHVHSSSEGAFHSPNATARPRRIPSPAKTPPHPTPGRRHRGYSGSRAGRAVGIFHGPHSPARPFLAPRAPPPGSGRRSPARSAPQGPGRWRPRAARAPGDRWNDPFLPALGPAAPAHWPLRRPPLAATT